MLNPTPQTTYLEDYRPPAFLIDNVALDIDIRDDDTLVTATLRCRRNLDSTDAQAALVLDGDELELRHVKLDGVDLDPARYDVDDDGLTLPAVPDAFEIETLVSINPDANTQLMGLYRSKDGYFTQCEAEGFRRITYFPDRPDVMSCYQTTIHADYERCPLLLSNGNLVAEGEDENGRHWAEWHDPFPKPSYLFAMVAARLDRISDSYKTLSGRDVDLHVFVEPGKSDQATFAMEALKAAMRWDEDVFGLELDLDQYMIVAVSDFNMGAMENKGLNIFNTKYVLARPDTATDTDFMMLDRVVAHEYFHNWTGNRVTCRDWFQLSLKEGLTVFRDQRYGEDRYSQAVQRIQEVRSLRSAQFPEDAGPMAHPVRPDAYMEISNFYTATIYNKGAEVVRMIHTLIGAEAFRAGMDLYFERHDGQAVCIEDFVAAMESASGAALDQFQRWYHQAGTPRVEIDSSYDAAASQLTLTARQSCAPTPGQAEKRPFHIPIAFGLIDRNGDSVAIKDSNSAETMSTQVLSLTEPEQTFVIDAVPEGAIPSLLRHFSAPVFLKYDYSDDDLAHLMAYDADPFNRWEAGQRLALAILLRGIENHRLGNALEIPGQFTEATRELMKRAADDPAFTAEALALPSAAYIAEQLDKVDPDAILDVRLQLRRHIATALRSELETAYATFTDIGEYSPDAAGAGRRALKNSSLGYLMELDDPAIIERCLNQMRQANNMTDAIAALGALANSDCAERDVALGEFYARWRDEALVMDKWFAVQATSHLSDAFNRVTALMTHELFDLKNPNRVRAVIGAFCHANYVHFNAADGSGYHFAADQIIALDAINAQIAARLARSFDRWKKFDGARQTHAEAALQRIRATDGLSKDTHEVVANALAAQ